MLFKKKPLLMLLFKNHCIYYMIVDEQKKEIIEHDKLLLDVPVLVEGRLSNESLVQKKINLFVREKKLKNAKAYLILPDHFSMIRKEEVPVQLNEKEIKDYLYLQLDNKIRLPFDRPKLDFELLDQTSESQEILLVAYPEEFIQSFQTLMEAVQLYPEVADFSYLSLYRAFNQYNASEVSKDDHLLMIQWHPYDSSLTVFHEDIPQFSRQSNFHGVMQNWRSNDDAQWEWTGTQEELSVMVDDQINLIERFLDFYKYSIMNGEKMVTRILLTGDFPEFDYLYNKISDRIDIPLSKLKLPSTFSREYAPLLGMTLKKMHEKKRSKPKQNKNKVVDKK